MKQNEDRVKYFPSFMSLLLRAGIPKTDTSASGNATGGVTIIQYRIENKVVL